MAKETDAQIINNLVARSPILAHLHKNYPLLNETAGYWLSFSLLNTLTVVASSLAVQWKEFNNVYLPFVNQTIEFIEQTVVQYFFVNFIDAFFPVFKTLHLTDFTIQNIYSAAVAYIKSTFIFKKSLELVTAVLKYVNSNLVVFVNKDSSFTDSGDFKSEVNKFLQISYTLFDQLKSYPFKVQTHVQNVYNDEFSKNNNNSIKAIASTSNELATEITTKLSNGFKKQVAAHGPNGADSSTGTSTGINAVNGNGVSSVEVTTSTVNGQISVGA